MFYDALAYWRVTSNSEAGGLHRWMDYICRHAVLPTRPLHHADPVSNRMAWHGVLLSRTSASASLVDHPALTAEDDREDL